MINEYHIYGRKMCIWKDPLYLNSDFCLLRNSSYLYGFDENCLIHLLQIKRLALKRGLSETDKWLPSELHDCASAKCFQAFFFFFLFISVCCKNRISKHHLCLWNCMGGELQAWNSPEQRLPEGVMWLAQGYLQIQKHPGVRAWILDLKFTFKSFVTAATLKGLKLNFKHLHSVLVEMYLGLFFTYFFPSLFFFFLSLDYYHRCYPLSEHLHGYPLQTFSLS